ncbi:MAG: O-antigen ligase family protein, partial [Acidobacteriota bacterium]
MQKCANFLLTVRGIVLGALVGWSALRAGGVRPVDFYLLFMVLALLFVLSLMDGLWIRWWGWALLLPLLPMAFSGSVPYDLLQYAALWLAVILGAHQGRTDWRAGRQLSLMMILLLGTGVLEAILGLAQSLGRFAGQAIPFIPMGTIVNRNHFAGFLEILVPIALMIGFGKLYDGKRYQRSSSGSRTQPLGERAAEAWVFLMIGALLFLAILFSLSRGGTVAAMIGTVAAAALIYRRTTGVGKMRSRVLVAGILVLVAAGALWIGIQPVIERFVLLPEGAGGSAATWAGTVQIIRDHPLLGVGAGMHGWAFTRYQDRNPDYFYDHARNDYLEAAAEWGVPGAVVFFGVVLWLAWRAGGACLRSQDPVRAGLIAGGVGGVVALLVHSFVDFNLHIPSNA